MKTRAIFAGIGATGAILVACVGTAPVRAQTPSSQVTVDTVNKWMTDLSNWGRWGKADGIGTLNLITPDTRKKALALVKEAWRCRSRTRSTRIRRPTTRARSGSR